MKLLVLTNIHGHNTNIRKIYEKTKDKKIDVIIVCGDLTNFGDIAQATEILKDLSDFKISILFVSGNSDSEELATIRSIHTAVNVYGWYKEIEGLGFLGIGGSPFGPFQTPFERSKSELRQVLDETYRISKVGERFVLISNTPPADTKVDRTSFGFHTGSMAVREFIKKEAPALVLCGQIHEARGTNILESVLIVNPGTTYMGLYAIVYVNEDIKAKLDAL